MEWLYGIADSEGSRQAIDTISSIVTAISTATIAVMAFAVVVKTKVFAGAGGRAYVTVNLEPNPWAINQVDLLVSNSGTVAAYDVQVDFDPPLPTFERHRSDGKAEGAPLKHISLLRSSQLIRATLCQYAEISDIELSVSVSWGLQPQSKKREATSYRLLMDDYAGAAYSGARI